MGNMSKELLREYIKEQNSSSIGRFKRNV
ncbi:hypothetical protein CNEO4_260037 [Clostridium neonatale]|nr:hypothetical protein CNEO4_260037 [Clostridium neonatale]CAI4140115.1 hypothetical protein CNEO4_360038 [Clostridium neonatale]